MTTIDHHQMADVAIADTTRIPVKANATPFSLLKMLRGCDLKPVMRSGLLVAINLMVGNLDERACFLRDDMLKRIASNV